MNCGERIKENLIIVVIQQLKELQLEPENNIQSSTAFEPMTFRIPVQTLYHSQAPIWP